MYPKHTITNFSKTYKHHQVVIHDLTLKKQVTIIKGENGCGKSTLLRAMASLIQYDGEIIIKGRIGYMHEETTFPSELTVDQFFCALSSVSQKKDDYSKIVNLINHFQLSDKRNVYIKALSKGMRTKVNLISCLMMDKDIYLLDEPLSGLDEGSIKKLFLYMKDHPRKQFVITSHVFNSIHYQDCDVIYL